jgi:RNA polymerase sigma-70 factor, ECF subfamily
MIMEALASLEHEAMRLRGGDLEAVTGLMERYQHRLYRYLLRIVAQPSAAEDLFQQTWLRVMERIQKYDPKRNFEGWLFSLAHNLAIDHLRRRQPESLDEPTFTGETQLSLTPGDGPNALDELLSMERTERIAEAVAELPVLFREVIALRFEEELKLEEIAAVLSLPMGTVKTRVHRALKSLRIILARRSYSGDML